MVDSVALEGVLWTAVPLFAFVSVNLSALREWSSFAVVILCPVRVLPCRLLSQVFERVHHPCYEFNTSGKDG